MTKRREAGGILSGMARLTWLVLFASLLAAAAARGGEPWGFDPRFRTGEPEDVLAEGPPPLTRTDVDAFVDLVEAGFDLAIGAEREQALRDALEQEYDGLAPEARRALLDLVAPAALLRADVRARQVAPVDEGLAAFRRALDARLALATEDRPNAILRDVLRARGRLTWLGEPPIHALAADAWLELVELVVSLGRNEDVAPTEGQRSVVREDLVTALRAVDEPTRARLLRVHRAWIRLQAAWDAAGDARRLSLRMVAVRLLAQALPADRRITVGADEDLPAYARVATLLRAAEPAYDAWSNLARNPAPVLDAVEAWLGPAPVDGPAALLER